MTDKPGRLRRCFDIFANLFLAVGGWVILEQADPLNNYQDMAVLFLGICALTTLVIATHTFFSHRYRDRTAYVAGSVISVASFIQAVFAFTYFSTSHVNVDAFGTVMSKPDAAYFSISTATSTGMGDIHPVTGGARLLVAGQMALSVFYVATVLSIVIARIVSRQAKSDDPGRTT